jgi:hypothetical protein
MKKNKFLKKFKITPFKMVRKLDMRYKDRMKSVVQTAPSFWEYATSSDIALQNAKLRTPLSKLQGWHLKIEKVK